MSTALLAAVAGLLGLAVGRLWDVRSETSRWRRDQKVVSYQRLAEAFIVLYEDVRAIALAAPGTDAATEAVDRARRDKTWDNALVAVWLHGSAPVASAAALMDRVVTELFYGVQERLLSLADWNQARQPAEEAFKGFVTAVRDEFDLSSIPIDLFPHTPPH